MTQQIFCLKKSQNWPQKLRRPVSQNFWQQQLRQVTRIKIFLQTRWYLCQTSRIWTVRTSLHLQRPLLPLPKSISTSHLRLHLPVTTKEIGWRCTLLYNLVHKELLESHLRFKKPQPFRSKKEAVDSVRLGKFLRGRTAESTVFMEGRWATEYCTNR